MQTVSGSQPKNTHVTSQTVQAGRASEFSAIEHKPAVSAMQSQVPLQDRALTSNSDVQQPLIQESKEPCPQGQETVAVEAELDKQPQAPQATEDHICKRRKSVLDAAEKCAEMMAEDTCADKQ